MAFCKFSPQVINSTCLNVDNNFITQYMPYAPDSCVKVYLLGLYRCNNPESFNNTLTDFAKTLSLSEEDVESAFLYWQEQGLVQVINVSPIEVRYLPVKQINVNIKKFCKDKYENFNKEAQALIEGRMITPTEYAEYYTLLESMHMEQSALIMIIKYCTMLKGSSVGYTYILTVAKNWAYEGIKTAEAVEQKLLEHEQATGEIKQILKMLGINRNASFEERNLFIKWTKDLDFSVDVILFVAKSCKRKGGTALLDKKLQKYYELKLLTQKEIQEFEDNKENLLKTAKEITKAIGVYYENLDAVVDVYIVNWLQMGFSENSLKLIAQFCFKNSIRNLEGMNVSVKKFYALGLTTSESIEQYFSQILQKDDEIKKLLLLTGLNRNVNSWDRDYYNTWTIQWNFPYEVIEYACSLAVGKSQPLQYVNKILSNWKMQNILTLQDAQNSKIETVPALKPVQNFTGRSYSQEEISALFDTLGEVKI